MTKLTTTLKRIKAHDPCGQEKGSDTGWGRLRSYLGEYYPEDQEINLLTILESNGISDMFWAFRAVQQDERVAKRIAVELAIAFSESVLSIFEKEYPNDHRSRKAIEAAKTWLMDPTDENSEKARAAADAAYAAANAAASAAANAAANAADAAYAAAYAARAAAYAAYAAADAAAYAAADAVEYQKQIETIKTHLSGFQKKKLKCLNPGK